MLPSKPITAPYVTPPELAKIWKVAPEKIIKLIRDGDLAAVNLAARGSRRPRFRISQAAIEAFERGRAAIPQLAPAIPKQRRKADCALKRFI
jgi:hypothetical protein